MNKICIINIYWGELPKWFSFFLKSCELNKDIDFLILTDYKFLHDKKDNVRIREFTMSDFNKLASEKTGILINITFSYKVCDFKPLFGKIFEDYLINYSYWGFCDLDIVFGNISDFFNHQIKLKYDLISGYTDFISGPMCLFCNSPLMNNLYKSNIDYKSVLLSNKYEGFDEGFRNAKQSPLSIKKIIAFIEYIIISQISTLKKGFYTWDEIRFKFFFYYKRKTMSVPSDFSEIAWDAIRNKLIKACEIDLIFSDASLERKKIKNWSICFSDGKLTETNTKLEIPIFHFRTSKTKEDFYVTDQLDLCGNFEISPMGIKYI
jgi:hypothetical protein